MGLYRILVYSRFGLDRFIQDSGLFRVWFRQIYTGFWFIQGLVYTGFWFIQGLNQTLNKPESCINQTLNKPESCINLSKPNPE
jgi:hypothetical protein